ncbi:MAG: hypothetical protein FWB77_04095 [Treponema sp.]|nr:hypothetical protein [Treponema sp.]
MKIIHLKLTIFFILSVQLISCTDRFPSSYKLEFPETPESWVSLLGEPHWRLEWIDASGQKQTGLYLPRGSQNTIEIEIPVTWTNPVTAWPYWPEYNLFAGVFKPAGALFPFDVNGSYLCLSWEAGPDAVFYWELSLANDGNLLKIPANFDWIRFRELFSNRTLDEDVCEDPWLPDWRYIAEKTITSNFDRRRITAETAVSLPIPVFEGLWYGASPFAKPILAEKSEIPAFPVRSGVNVWISGSGILRVSGKTWILTETKK